MRIEEVYEQNRKESLLIYKSSGYKVEGRIGTSVAHLQINLGMRSTLFDLINPSVWRNRNAVWKNEVPLEGNPYHLSGVELLYRATQLQPDLKNLPEGQITSMGQQLFIVAESLKALSKEGDSLMRVVQPITLPPAS